MKAEKRRKLTELCKKHSIELTECKTEGHFILLITPRTLSDSVLKEIKDNIPEDCEAIIREGPRARTLDTFVQFYKSIGGDPFSFMTGLHIDNHHFSFKDKNINISEDHENILDAIRELLNKDKYINSWEVTLGSRVITNIKIKELFKDRPKRNHSINKDDITNLKIVLSEVKDVMDIIKDLS